MPDLEAEERDIIEAYERDEFRGIPEQAEELNRYRQYARETFKKDARVNIRISKMDLESLQKRALEEGIPYQTLMASVLHKYINGRLVERTN